MKALLVLLLCSPCAGFFQSSGKAPAHKLIECTHGWDTLGCRSFQQMTDNNDTEVIDRLRPPLHAFVCFPSDNDRFIIASYVESKSPSAATVEISTYSHGVQDWSWTFLGHWINAGKNLAFVSNENPEGEQRQDFAAIDDTEVEIRNTFPNTSGGNSTEILRIRRPTLRFAETINGIITNGREEKPLNVAYTGYCAEFK